MAEPKRKKKLEKSGTPAVTTPPSSNVYCVRCGMAYSRRKGYFAASHSPMYRGLGYIPICNTCLDKMFEDYCREMGPKEALHRMCLKLDLYWDEEIYDSVERTAGMASRIRSYIGRCNLVKWIDKNYDDTLRNIGIIHAPERIGAEATDEVDKTVPTKEPVATEDDEIWVDPEVIEFWGEDFKPEFILKLDRRYKYWTSDFKDGELDKGSVALYKQICILEETINRDAADGRPVDKYQSMLNTLLGSANLKPVQKKEESANSSADNSPMGVWIRRFENERPIPEPDPELRDVDKIIHYIQVFFLGHLAKLLGKNEIYSKMYEDEIARLRVERPEVSLDFDGDDEGFFESLYGSVPEDGDDM